MTSSLPTVSACVFGLTTLTSATVGFSCRLTKHHALLYWWFGSKLFYYTLEMSSSLILFKKNNLAPLELHWCPPKMTCFLFGLGDNRTHKYFQAQWSQLFLFIYNNLQMFSNGPKNPRSWLRKLCSWQQYDRLDWTKAKIFSILFLKDRHMKDSKNEKM